MQVFEEGSRGTNRFSVCVTHCPVPFVDVGPDPSPDLGSHTPVS